MSSCLRVTFIIAEPGPIVACSTTGAAFGLLGLSKPSQDWLEEWSACGGSTGAGGKGDGGDDGETDPSDEKLGRCEKFVRYCCSSSRMRECNFRLSATPSSTFLVSAATCKLSVAISSDLDVRRRQHERPMIRRRHPKLWCGVGGSRKYVCHVLAA